jgi:hypothetical protein
MVTKTTRLYLTTGYRFKLRYSHSTLQLFSTGIENRYGLFRVRSDDSTVYVGSVEITYKYLRIEHEFEGLTFYDKYSFDDIQIIKPN